MTEATVVFLQNENGEICLARKKQPIHTESQEISYSLGMWNGYGGKREEGDMSVEDTAVRELSDESRVFAVKEDLKAIGDVQFFLKEENEDSLFMRVYFYMLREYDGVPKEGSEMGVPEFFALGKVPYADMMPADKVLLPKMFAGEMVRAKVVLYGKEKEPLVIFEE